MIVGYNFFGDSNSCVFDDINCITNINSIKLSNATFDELNIRRKVNLIYSTVKDTWNYDNIMLCSFLENLEAGNTEVSGLTISSIVMKRRKIEDLQWETINETPFETGAADYIIYDRFVEALQRYEYSLTPKTDTGILGNENLVQVDCDFDGAWLVGKEQQYKFIYNLEIGGFENVIEEDIIKTISNKYPIVPSNGMVNYKKGNFRCMIISDTTIENYGQIDRKVEKLNRIQIENFITDKKPKLFKNSDGTIMLVKILGNPVLSPRNDLVQKIYEVDLSFVEIGATDIETLKENGLVIL